MLRIVQRFRILLLAFVAAVGLGGVLFLKSGGSDEQWLASRSLNDLKRLADAPAPDPLTCVVYGEKLARNNKPQAALEAYQRAFQLLESDRRDALALRVAARMGYQLSVLKDDERARLYLDRANGIDKNYWLATLGEGVGLLNQQKSGRALDLLRRAVAHQPHSYETYYYLAVAENDERDLDNADRDLAISAAIAPEFAPVHAEIGRAEVRKSNYDLAAKHIREARRLDPSNSEYLFGLAKVLCLSAQTPSEYHEAAALQNECLRLSPGSSRLLLALGQLHLKFMDLDEAFRCLKEASSRSPRELIPIYTLARVAELRGNPEEARVSYNALARGLRLRGNTVSAEKRVLAHPKDPQSHLDLARSLHASGDLQDCYVQLRLALALRPNLAEAHKEMDQLRIEYQHKLDNNRSSSAGGQENGAGAPSAPEDTAITELNKAPGTVP